MDDIEDSIFEGGHFRDDDGNEIDVDQIPIPLMCLSCMKFGMRGGEYVLCTLNRIDQKDDKIFRCAQYRLK